MAITTQQTVNVAQAIGDLLAAVQGLRVYEYVADTARPPCVVLGLPSIDWRDPDSTFCWARWEFPLTIVTARNNDRDAQQDLSRLLRDVANALNGPAPEGVFDINPLDARPSTATIGGQELPAYQMRVAVRA